MNTAAMQTVRPANIRPTLGSLALLVGVIFVAAADGLPGEPAGIRYFEGHTEPVRAVAVAPDGKTIASAGLDRSVIIWDAGTGTIVRRIAAGDQSLLAVDIAPDGRKLAFAGVRGRVRVFDLPLRHPQHEFPALDHAPTALAVSADGAVALTGDEGKTLRVWNVAEGSAARDLAGTTGPVTAVALLQGPGSEDAPGPLFAVAAAEDGSLRGWDANTGTDVGVVHTPPLTALAAPAAGGWLAAGGADGRLRRIAWPPPKPATLGSHSHPVSAALLAPDGNAVTATAGGAVQWFDPQGEPLRQFTGLTQPVTRLAASPDGALLAAATEAGEIRVWTSADGADRGRLTGHEGPVRGLAFHPEGGQLATAGADGTVRVWNLPLPSRTCEGHTQPIQAIAISPDGKALMTASADKTLRRWSLDDALPDEKPPALEQPTAPTAVAYRNDHDQLATGDADGHLRLLDAADGTLQAHLGAHKGAVAALRYHPAEPLLLSASADGTVKVWDAAPTEVRELAGHEGPVTAVALAADGLHAFTGGDDGSVRQFDAAAAKSARSYGGMEGPVRSLALSPNEALLAAAGAAGVVRFWDTADAADRLALRGHEGAVHGVTFHPAGDQVATAGEDGTIRIWNLPQPPTTLSGHQAAVKTADLSPDGALAMTLAEDVRLWNGADGEATAQLAAAVKDLTTAALSPDTKQVATGDAAGRLRLWDTVEGAQEADLIAHDGPVGAVAYRPGGVQVATGGADGTVKLWRLPAAGSDEPLAKHTAAIRRLALSRAEAWVAMAGADGTVRLVTAADGKTLRDLDGGPESVRALAVAPDDALLAAGGEDGSIHFWQADGSQRGRLQGHAGAVEAVGFHPEGTRLASAGADGTVRLWQLPAAPRPLAGHGKPVGCVALSADGTLAAAGSEDHTVRLWEAETGTALWSLTGHAAPVTAVALNSDGTEVASGDEQGAIRLTGAVGKAERGVLGAHTGAVTVLRYDPEADFLVSAAADGTIRRWQLPFAAPTTLEGHATVVAAVAISADAKRVFTGGADQTVRVFDAETGSQTLALAEQPGPVTALALSPGGDSVASGSATGILKLWATGDGAGEHAIGAHDGPATTLRFSPDGAQLASGGADGIVRLWRRPSAIRDFGAHPQGITAFALSPDGSTLATGGADRTVHLWSVEKGERVRTLSGHTGTVTALAWRADGTRLASGSADRTVRVWNTSDGSELTNLTGHGSTVSAVAFHPTQDAVASGSADKTIRLWTTEPPPAADDEEEDAPEFTPLLRELAGHTGAVTALRFTGDGNSLISGSADGSVRQWATASGKETRKLDFGAPVAGCALSPGGAWIAAAGAGPAVKLWNAANGQPGPELAGLAKGAASVAFSPDAKRIVACAADGNLRVWDLAGRMVERATIAGVGLRGAAFGADGRTVIVGGADGRVRVAPLAHQGLFVASKGPVTSLAFVPGGEQLLVGAEDKTVQLWDLAGPMSLRRLAGNAEAVTAVAVSPDGKLAASAAADGAVRLWWLADGSARATFTITEPVRSLAFSHDSARLAVGGDEPVVRVFDLPTDRLLQRFAGHGAGVTAVAFAADGTTLVSASADRTARVWRLAATGTWAPHAACVNDIALSADGRQVYSVGDDKLVRLTDVAKAESRQFDGSTGELHAVALRPDGEQVAAAGADKNVYLWSTADGKPAGKLAIPAPARCLRYTPDGKRLLVACEGNRLLLIDTGDGRLVEEIAVAEPVGRFALAPDGRTVLTTGAGNQPHVLTLALDLLIPAHEGAATCLAFTPDGTEVLSGGADNAVRAWQLDTGAAAGDYRGHDAAVRCLAVTPDGERVLAGGADSALLVWNAGQEEPAAKLSHPAGVGSLCCSGDGARVATAAEDGLVHVWDLAAGHILESFAFGEKGSFDLALAGDGQTVYAGGPSGTLHRRRTTAERVLVASEGGVTDLAFSADGSLLLTGTDAGKVELWTLEEEEDMAELPGTDGPVRAVAIQPDGARLAAAVEEKVLVWKREDASLQHTITLPGPVTDLAFRADGSQLAVAGEDGHLRVYDPADGLLLVECILPAAVASVKFAPDGAALLAAGGANGYLVPLPLRRVVRGHTGAVLALCYTPDGKTLLSGGADKSARLWDVQEGTERVAFPEAGDAVGAVAVTPDGATVAVAGNDKMVRLFGIEGGDPVASLEHPDAVKALAPSPDSARLATACADGVTRVWDLATRRELERFSTPDAASLGVAFAADARALVTGSADGLARLWTLAARHVVVADAGKVHDAAWLPDGAGFLSAGDDGQVKLWDAEGRPTGTVPSGDTPAPLSFVAARSDGRQIAAGGDPQRQRKTVFVWDRATGEPAYRLETPDAVTGIAYSADAAKLAVGSGDGKVRVYRADDGVLLQDFAAAAPVSRVAFAPDSKTLVAAAGNDATVFHFTLAQLLAGHASAVDALQYTPDGSQLLGAGADAVVRQWDLATGAVVASYAAETEALSDLAVGRAGRQIIAGSRDGKVRLWDYVAQSNEPVEPRSTFDHAAPVTAVAGGAAGDRVASAGDDGVVRIWDVTVEAEIERLLGHQGPVLSLDISADASRLLSGGADNSARVRQPSVKLAAAAHQGPVLAVACSEDGTQLVTAGDDSVVAQWSADGLQPGRKYAGSTGPLAAVDLCTQRGVVAVAGEDRFLRLWNMADGEPLLAEPLDVAPAGLCLAGTGRRLVCAVADGSIRHYAVDTSGPDARLDLIYEGLSSGEPLVALALAADGHTLLSVSADKKLRRWFAAAAEPAHTFEEHRGPVYTARFSPDSARLAAGGADGTVRLWDFEQPDSAKTLEFEYPVLAVAYPAQGTRLAVGGLDGAIGLFDAEAKPVRTFAEDVKYPVLDLRFNAAGNSLLSAGGGVWQLWSESSDTPGRTQPGHNGVVTGAAYNPAASRIASVDDLGEVRVWDTSGNLLHHQRLPVPAVRDVAYTPDGAALVIAAEAPRVLLLTLPEKAR